MPERWSLRRLTNVREALLVEEGAKRLGQSNCSCAFSFAQRGGAHAGHNNVLPAWRLFKSL